MKSHNQRGSRGKSRASQTQARHKPHDPRETCGKPRPCTGRERREITDRLNKIRATPRELEPITPGRSDSFWHAAKTGVWGNCKPTVADLDKIREIYAIDHAFRGKYEQLKNDALNLAADTSRVTLSARKLLDDVMRVLEASNGGGR